MMCKHLVMTCRPTLLVLIGLTLLYGTSSTSSVEEPLNDPTQKQLSLLSNETIEATEEMRQLMKSVNELLDVLLTNPDKPVETKQTETEFFLFTEEKKNWFEAYGDCRIKGMALASIESDEDYGNLTEKITALDIPMSTHDGDFWLSGTDLGYEGKFVWMSTGRPVTVNKWISGEPDHSQVCDEGQKEHCIEINRFYNNSMNDYCCEKRQNYICERRKINQ